MGPGQSARPTGPLGWSLDLPWSLYHDPDNNNGHFWAQAGEAAPQVLRRPQCGGPALVGPLLVLSSNNIS